MSIPAHMLPHEPMLVRPAVGTDVYNNESYDYGEAATRTPIAAWLQQDVRRELLVGGEGRDPQDQRWLLVTNHEDVRALDRIEWAAHPSGIVTFQIDGPPEPAYTPRGFHHTEATLRIITG